MKLFYETYSHNEKLAPLVREIGWTHNIVIVEKCKDDLDWEFYIRCTAGVKGSAPCFGTGSEVVGGGGVNQQIKLWQALKVRAIAFSQQMAGGDVAGGEKGMSETKKLAIAIPKEELAQFCQRHHIRKLSLLGSVLRDDFTPESDIDFLVEFEPGKTRGFFKIFNTANNNSLIIPQNFNVVKIHNGRIDSAASFHPQSLDTGFSAYPL